MGHAGEEAEGLFMYAATQAAPSASQHIASAMMILCSHTIRSQKGSKGQESTCATK